MKFVLHFPGGFKLRVCQFASCVFPYLSGVFPYLSGVCPCVLRVASVSCVCPYASCIHTRNKHKRRTRVPVRHVCVLVACGPHGKCETHTHGRVCVVFASISPNQAHSPANDYTAYRPPPVSSRHHLLEEYMLSRSLWGVWMGRARGSGGRRGGQAF